MSPLSRLPRPRGPLRSAHVRTRTRRSAGSRRRPTVPVGLLVVSWLLHHPRWDEPSRDWACGNRCSAASSKRMYPLGCYRRVLRCRSNRLRPWSRSSTQHLRLLTLGHTLKKVFLTLFGRVSASASVVFGVAFVAVGIYIATGGHVIAALIALVLGVLALVAALLQYRMQRESRGDQDSSNDHRN